MTMKPKGRPLGAGASVREWIRAHPDRYVTRQEIGMLFAMFDRARQHDRWYRRLWRWLTAPYASADLTLPTPPHLPAEDPSTPP